MYEGFSIVVGLDEKVILIDNNNKEKEVLARIDTGADGSSIDKELFESMTCGPFISQKKIKSASGENIREQVELKFKIKEKEFVGKFNIADRSKLRYKVLIGQNILKKGFLIDPTIKKILKKDEKDKLKCFGGPTFVKTSFNIKSDKE